MTMNRADLIPIDDLARQGGSDMRGGSIYDPSGATAYGMNDDKIGRVDSALVEPGTGKIRYLIVDVGGWFSSKKVLVPVGMARFENDAVYFSDLTRDQVQNMRTYHEGDTIDHDDLAADESVLRGRAVQPKAGDRYDYRDSDANDRMFKTPERLQLLEERLVVDKHRERVGTVEVGKKVETREQQVNVDLSHDEVVIEHHPVTDRRATDGARLGADSERIRVDVEAERADVNKQTFVADEVDVRKRRETETRTFNEQVGREVLDVNKTGDLRVEDSDDKKRR